MKPEIVLLASAAIESLVKWEFCDCGCPNQKSPASNKDCELLRLAAFLRVTYLPDNYEIPKEYRTLGPLDYVNRHS